MRARPARVIALLAFALMAVLALATLRSWTTYRSLQQNFQTSASLTQSVTDAAQINTSLRIVTDAAVGTARGNARLAPVYVEQRQVLLGALGRLRDELGIDSILADRAALLDRQTQSLLQSLDTLVERPVRPHHQSQTSFAAIHESADAAQANAIALRQAAQAQASGLEGSVPERSVTEGADTGEGVTAAALNDSRLTLQVLAVLLGLTLIAAFSLFASSSAPAVTAAAPAPGANLSSVPSATLSSGPSASLSSAIVRTSPQMIVTCDLAGNVRSLNPTAEALLRDKESAVVARGNKLRDFLVAGEELRLAKQLDPATPSPHHASEFRDTALISALNKHWRSTPLTELHQWPLQFRSSDGTAFTRMTSIAPLRGSSGGVEGFFLMASNSSTIKFTEELIQKIEGKSRDVIDLKYQKESILNAAADGIFGLDPSGSTLFANPSAASLLRSTPAALASRDLHTLLHAHRPGGLPACAGQCNILRALTGTELVTALDTLFHADGTGLPIEFSASPMLEHGRNVGTVFSVRDISQRDALDRLKDEFVSTVSHELRTPLTSIRGALGLLNSGAMGPVSEKANDLLRIALTNTDRLMRLINDVLDLERMESGSAVLEFRRADFCDLIQQAAETMRPMADAAGVQIEFTSAPCSCEVDADRILQVFTNLFSNAIKFSEAGSSISVSLSAGEEILSIAVSDQGRGIPEKKLEKVFDRFQQVDASDSRQKGGTGLGLAICRSILQQHGGRIWAERGVPRGTTFRMVIPRIQVRSAQRDRDVETRDLATVPLLQQSILVCDDDPIARSMVRHHLEQHGYNVLEAESGEQAIAMAQQHLLDAILLDLFMPGMNGWETLQGLKSNVATAAIPVVVLSVFTSRQYESDDIREVHGWVNKPFSQHSLLTAVGSALEPGNTNTSIVLVENDNDQAALITSTFASSGLTVYRATSRQQALRLCQTIQPRLMVLNLALPNDDGMQLVSWLRQHDELHKMPLVVYSGREISNEDLELITQGPAQFMERSRVQPAEVAQLVLNMLRRQRNNTASAAFETKALLATESGGRTRAS